jgi:hypothetical protein
MTVTERSGLTDTKKIEIKIHSVTERSGSHGHRKKLK